jgi:hypothetical protein
MRVYVATDDLRSIAAAGGLLAGGGYELTSDLWRLDDDGDGAVLLDLDVRRTCADGVARLLNLGTLPVVVWCHPHEAAEAAQLKCYAGYAGRVSKGCPPDVFLFRFSDCIERWRAVRGNGGK